MELSSSEIFRNERHSVLSLSMDRNICGTERRQSDKK